MLLWSGYQVALNVHNVCNLALLRIIFKRFVKRKDFIFGIYLVFGEE